MPVHDWARVVAGTVHDFHCSWITHLKEALNHRLPEGFYALAEQHAGTMIADILTLQAPGSRPDDPPEQGAIAVAVAPPRTRRRLIPPPSATYRAERKSIAIRHTSGHRLVALVEIASPANKDRVSSVEDFSEKIVSALKAGVHVLLVDLIPPGRYDPNGLHGAIWSAFAGEQDEIDPEAPLTLASYVGTAPTRLSEAYVEPVAVGMPLIDMPVFLDSGRYVNVPLEPTSEAAYRGMPRFWREVIEGIREADQA